MAPRTSFIKALIALAVIWLPVTGIRTWARSRIATAEAATKAIETAHLAARPDNPSVDTGEAARREKEIRNIAGMINRLDFQEREKTRTAHTLETLYRNLNGPERKLFLDLTVRESMNQFMAAFDAMKPKERRKFVEQGLKEIEQGLSAEDMKRVKDIDGQLLERITSDGMRAYFDKADTDGKLELAPLMEAVNETMKGLRGGEHGGAHGGEHGPPG